ncbi:cell wall-binding repeat-containing protein, partial [Peptacetobacter hiranonis]|uniref:cell wall-binding repeat-containing protein n=1 Tax=Peptacetobacter hiranonis TaxID=89152 RepID=UPI002E760C7B
RIEKKRDVSQKKEKNGGKEIMNKKRLSVVMAGAMLASSVAPVLAAEVQKSEVSESNKGTLINELTDLLWGSARFSSKDDTYAGKSVYTILVDGKEAADVHKATIIANNTKSSLQNEVKKAIEGLTAGSVVKVVKLGSTEVEENGKKELYSKAKTTKYTLDELKTNVASELSALETEMTQTNYEKLIDTKTDGATGYNALEQKFTITFKVDINGDSVVDKDDKLVLTKESDRLDFTRVTLNDGQTLTVSKMADKDFAANFKEFPKADAVPTDIEDTIEREYTITASTETFALSDLFDGVMLTEKGQNLLNLVKDVKAVTAGANKVGSSKDIESNLVRFVDANAYSGNSFGGTLGTNTFVDIEGKASKLTADKNGVFKVRVEIANSYRVAKDIADSQSAANTWDITSDDYDAYYVTADSSAELTKILSWLDKASANVDVLAGDDRYETAVKIAKEVALYNSSSKVSNIVLVNGDSLVDGLAASPLAAKLGNAPILLTESGKLPKATKAYLQELVDEKANKDITVNIVGGDGVVSNSVKEELKDMNLKVKRFGGDDRESTSMAVAEAIVGANDITRAYVVGATGEADAMSIAGKAAEEKAPIIVSGFEGLSEETVDSLKDANVDVIGGDASVSESDFNNLKSVTKVVRRVSGSDRKATNAEVINTFYKGDFASQPQSVIVAKDDVLIDALTSANLSAVHHAPIVLGTKELSEAQVNAIVKNAKNAQKVYQVGYGVDPQNVVKLVAQSLGLI